MVAVVSRGPFCPQHPPNATFQAVGSQLHALRWTFKIKSTQTCHKRDLQHWGDFHLPQGPSSGGIGLSEPLLPPISPKFNVPSCWKPTPCVGVDIRSRLDPLRHAIKRTSITGGAPACLRGHPMVAVVSPGPFCPQYPQNSTFRVVECQLHALGWTFVQDWIHSDMP